MCGYKTEAWRVYQAAWTRDKLEAAEHALENAEAELRRAHKFIVKKGMTAEWVSEEMGHA